MPFCGNCGTQLSAGSRFCTHCGAPVSAEQPASPQTNNVVSSAYAAARPVSQPVVFYMDPKGITVVNYRFTIRDAAGRECLYAETQPTAITYKMHITDLYGNELLVVQQSKKLTMASVNFEMWKNGQLLTNVIQRVKLTTYNYDLPELGMRADGKILMFNFTMSAGDRQVAQISKKVLAWGDSYEILINDPRDTEAVLGFVTCIQMLTIRNRHKRLYG